MASRAAGSDEGRRGGDPADGTTQESLQRSLRAALSPLYLVAPQAGGPVNREKQAKSAGFTKMDPLICTTSLMPGREPVSKDCPKAVEHQRAQVMRSASVQWEIALGPLVTQVTGPQVQWDILRKVGRCQCDTSRDAGHHDQTNVGCDWVAGSLGQAGSCMRMCKYVRCMKVSGCILTLG